MAEPRYRAAPPDAIRSVPLDTFTAIYHRPSGVTHLVTSPAPELMELLAGAPLTRDDLATQLAQVFDVADLSQTALDERLTELVGAGLVLAS